MANFLGFRIYSSGTPSTLSGMKEILGEKIYPYDYVPTVPDLGDDQNSVKLNLERSFNYFGVLTLYGQCYPSVYGRNVK